MKIVTQMQNLVASTSKTVKPHSSSVFSLPVSSLIFFALLSILLVLAPALVLAQGGPGPGGPSAWTNFTFNGTIKNSTYDVMANVNVSVWTMFRGPENPSLFLASNLTDDIGNFSITVLSPQYPAEYQMPVLIKMTAYDADGNATWTNPPIPPFPTEMITNFLDGETLYVVPASTLIITATNESTSDATMYYANFSGGITDDKFGSEFDQFWPPEQPNFRSVVLAQGRNYTLIVMKQWDQQTQLGVPPLTVSIYDVNLSENSVFNITINITSTEKLVTGNISISDENLDVQITDLVLYPTGGGMFPSDMPPMQIPSFDFSTGQPDDYKGQSGYHINGTTLLADANTTFFNSTLVGSGSGIEYVLGIFGRNGTQGGEGTQYYGMWQNFTVATSDVEFNLSLQPLAGNYSVGSNGFPVNTTSINISVVYNMSGTMTKAQQGGGGILTVKSHAEYGRTQIKAMAQPDDEGAFRFTMIQGSNATFQMFNKQFAPKEMIVNLSAIEGQVQLELKNFDVHEPGSGGHGAEITGGTFIAMYTSNSSCNVQVPDQSTCQIFNFSHAPGQGENAEFNPVKMLLGGLVNVYIVPPSGPSVYMIGVDLMASGPPDFNPPSSAEADNTLSGRFDQIWTVGSVAPNMIFTYSYVGIPYNSSTLSTETDINITLDLLYDTEYNLLWNMSAYPDSATAIDSLPEEFQDFVPDYACYFNDSAPCTCSASDTTGLCYVDRSQERAYLKIKHFTGDSPHITGDGPIPNLTITSPTNGTYYNSANITVQFDYGYSYDQCWITNATGGNESSYNCAELNATTLLFDENILSNITVGYNDTSGNINSTEVYFTVDTILPYVSSFASPTNTTYNTSNTTITFESGDALAGIDQCWFSLDSGNTNTTMTGCANTTVLASEGANDLFIYVNDTADNVNSSNVSFIVDTAAALPAFQGQTPDNLSYTNASFTINASFEEEHPINCWVSNETNPVYYMTMEVINSSLVYCSVEFSITDYFNYTVYVNDSAGITNNTDTRFITADMIYPAITDNFPNETIAGSAVVFNITTNITFNISDRFLNETYLIADNFFISERGSESQVNGTLNYTSIASSTGYEDVWFITLDPFIALGYNMTYLVNISGIYDIVGNPLADNYVFNFTTMESDATTVAQVVGNVSYIDTNIDPTTFGINVTVNGTDSYIAENDTYLVQFANLTGNAFLEFNFTLNDSIPLNLHNVTLLYNPNATRGSVLVRNLDLAGSTKNVFIDNLTAMDGVCIADNEYYDNIDDFSENCTGTYEVWLPCPGTNSSYTCSYDSVETRFKITGLSNSLVIQNNDTIPPDVLSMSAPSSTVTSTTTTLTVTTNENATCRYSASADTSYDSMSLTYETSLGTTHSFSISGLSTGTATYYVKCKDAYSNAMSGDYTASFTVSIPSTTTISQTSSGTSAAALQTLASSSLMWASIAAGTSVAKTVSGGDFPFASIQLASKTTKTNVALQFSKMSGVPTNINAPSGKIYAYLQVSPSNIVNNDLSGNIVYNIRVKKSWVTENSLQPGDIVMKKWLDSSNSWEELSTTKTSEDATYYYYDTTSPGFSYYVIGQKSTTITPAATTTTPAVAAAETPSIPTTPTAEPTPIEQAATATPAAEAKKEETPTAPGAEAAVKPEEKAEVKKARALLKPWQWGIVVLIIAACAILGYYMLSHKKPGQGGHGHAGTGRTGHGGSAEHETHEKHDLSELKK